MRRLRMLNWNVGGAKFLETPEESDKQKFRDDLNLELQKLIKTNPPDVITLQEVVEYNKPGELKTSIIDSLEGYRYYSCTLLDNIRYPYVSKWRNVRGKGNWPKGSYFAQGNAILWREELLHFPVFSLPKIDVEPDNENHVQDVILMSGLYFGDRNTEPRVAMVSHFMIVDDSKQGKYSIPLDVFIVNLHLTTLKREREGVPRVDKEASEIRSAQLDIILDGIISRYNDWRQSGYRFRDEEREEESDETFIRFSPIWIICGDFNFTPESLEYAKMQRMNFVDIFPNKGNGTKGKGVGSEATLTVDYIFAGPKFIALEPTITDKAIENNPPPNIDIMVSDHYPMFGHVTLTTLSRK